MTQSNNTPSIVESFAEQRNSIMIEKTSWEKSQQQEVAFHKRSETRKDTESFRSACANYWRTRGFCEEQFSGKTLLDIGAGSKSRAFYFKNCIEKIAIEPSAEIYMKEIEWCDLRLEFTEIFSLPGEEHIARLDNAVDFAYSINVLDHCYELDAVIHNIASYMKQGALGLFCLDHAFQTDSLHPLLVSEELFFSILRKHELTVTQYRRQEPFHRKIANHSGAWYVSR